MLNSKNLHLEIFFLLMNIISINAQNTESNQTGITIGIAISIVLGVCFIVFLITYIFCYYSQVMCCPYSTYKEMNSIKS